ncbi:AAA family ATPase [Nostoc punctiforme]|uniref:AAA ATPase, central domain protein n=1 Tax=Nostoc punctiforme (strain ATCC 29133 / PCC 73102) TaxID=63737 RepID=B2IZY5_NOSP7|nr:AAA family ATPase [Nostoc punctiforme]ACC81756.1 AAA ATPase, central domain protein [Nostoc punctiforme PCC 73102]
MDDIDLQNLDSWKTLILQIIKNNSLPEERSSLIKLQQFLDKIRTPLEEFPRLKSKIDELQKQSAELIEPPLEYGVFLGKCPTRSTQFSSENEREIVVGVRGQRFEVKLATEEVPVEVLSEGQQLILNKVLNVVGVDNEQVMRGETAEVVNVISPVGTARVMNVPTDDKPVRVQSLDGNKFEVNCALSLRKSLHPGNIVQLDESQTLAIAKVKPRLHIRSGGNDGIVVEISDRLFQEGVEIGDLIRVDTRLQFAFEKLPSYQTGGLTLEEVPDVTYEDIGGLDDQTEAIKDAIELPYVYQKLFEEYQLVRPKGILLYGPPGCGKTMIAKAVANSLTQSIRSHLQEVEQKIILYQELSKNPDNQDALVAYQQLANNSRSPETVALIQNNISPEETQQQLVADLRLSNIDLEDINNSLERIQNILRREDGIRSFFLNVKGPELLNKYVGETENRIRKIFAEAKRRATFYTPVVIFFDEMEAMFRTRGSGRSSDVETTIVPQFLAEMDGVEATENIVIIGASNRPDMIDPAIQRPGRLDIKIKIDLPSRDSAIAILALHLTPDLPLQPYGLTNFTDSTVSTVPVLTFKPHVVQKTLNKLGENLTRLLDQIIAAIPHKFDVRKAKQESQNLINLCADEQVRKFIEEVALREQLAEEIIVDTVEFLFSVNSYLEAVTKAGKYYKFPLSIFISGAVLVSIVSRGKKIALKRQIATRGSQQLGLELNDLKEAMQEEFKENAEQLATNQLQEEIKSVNIYLGEEKQDPWSMEKLRIPQAS